MITSVLLVTSCSSDEGDFAYPMEKLYGRWEATDVQVDGTWYDITKYPYTKFRMAITFKKDGTFYGSGYLGDGRGTYETDDKTITTYVNDKEYAVYTVNSLTNNVADIILQMGNESIRMKAEKTYSTSDQEEDNDLAYKTFYESYRDGYYVIDFISNNKFAYFQTDKNFIQTHSEWTGFYDYNPTTGKIDFHNTIVLSWYGFLVENRKLLKGNYNGSRVSVEYQDKFLSGDWSSKYTMYLYPRNSSSIK